MAFVTCGGFSSQKLGFVGLKKEKGTGWPLVLGKCVYDGIEQPPPLPNFGFHQLRKRNGVERPIVSSEHVRDQP